LSAEGSAPHTPEWTLVGGDVPAPTLFASLIEKTPDQGGG